MKQRTFLLTLALFLFFFNFGIFIISVAMFRDTLSRAEERCLAEHYFIASALLKDFRAVESRGADVDVTISALLQPYSDWSGDTKTSLAIYKNNERVYSSQKVLALQDSSFAPPGNGNRLATLRNVDDRTYIIVLGKFPAPYDSYTLAYLYDTTEAISSWSRLKNNLFLAGCVLSILFALGLLMVLNRIFRPLQQISQTSRNIAGGAYETRLPVSGHDELSEMAQNFNDMAQEIQRQMTELKVAADRKQQFIDNFAHELRTPLTAIYGYAEYVQKAAVSEDDRLSALDYIMSESRRLQTIAFQLLELANLQNHQITCEEVDVAGLFERVRQTLSARLIGRDVQLDFNAEIETLYGDACLLESLLINLVDNALKACAEGGHIVVGAMQETGRKTLTAQDDGKGMSPEVLAQITEPFYRAEKSRSRSDGGAGLGLALCKQIAACHGAQLSFTSRPGAGTTAKVTFTTR